MISKYSNAFVPMIFIVFLFVGIFENCKDQAKQNPNPVTVNIPNKFSEFNLLNHTERGEWVAKPGGIPYDLNTALFSDYAVKQRIIFLPPNTEIQYKSEDVFEFPIGTKIIKTFSLPNGFKRQDGLPGKILETRILIHQPKGWYAVAYTWDGLDQEATVAYGGKNIPIEFKNKNGELETFNYAVPSRNQCSNCHQSYQGRTQSIVPIGPKAKHLNRDFSYIVNNKTIIENQLTFWSNNNFLVGKPYWGIPKLVDAFDTKESIQDRARAYLDINCAHCHNQNASGGMNSKLILSSEETDMSKLGVCKTPGSAGKGGGGLSYDIVPGQPERSILYYRSATQDPGAMMPQIGRALTHHEGMELLYDWIQSMEKKDCP